MTRVYADDKGWHWKDTDESGKEKSRSRKVFESQAEAEAAAEKHDGKQPDVDMPLSTNGGF